MFTFSIIIPSLNEAAFFSTQQAYLKSILQQGHEIIVIDGGSSDDSINLAEKIGCKCKVTKASRGHQLHAGANLSTNDILLFLHADTALPSSGLNSIVNAFTYSKSSWGRFNVSFINNAFIFKIIAWFMNKRSCLTGIATGDQAIFIKRKTYFDSGGFPNIPIMEDIELCKRLKKHSRPICLQDAVTTSSRKWEQQGIIETILLMWRLRALYFFGVSAEKLVKQYYQK